VTQCWRSFSPNRTQRIQFLPTLSTLLFSPAQATAAMSYPPINLSLLPPPRVDNSFFLAQPAGEMPALLSQPEPNPSVILDINNSTTIGTVRGLLSSDFVDSHAAWLHLSASIVTDIRNGIRNSLAGNSIEKFRDLTPAEQANLDSLKLAIESFDAFLSDCQSTPDNWITCFGCIQSYHLPVNKSTWDANLITCNQMIQAASETIINDKVCQAHTLIEAWITRQCMAAYDAAINHLVSDHTPDLTQVISDACVTEWSCRLLETMRLHFRESLVDKASQTLAQPLRDQLDAQRQQKVNEVKANATEEAQRMYNTSLQNLQASALAEAERDFEAWKTNILIPKWKQKEADAWAEKDRGFATFKHALTVETDERKEVAQLAMTKSHVHSKSETRRASRKDRRADPTRVSRSVSRATSPSPSPSPRATDKTPMKADFTSSQVPAPVTSSLMESAVLPVSTEMECSSDPAPAPPVTTTYVSKLLVDRHQSEPLPIIAPKDADSRLMRIVQMAMSPMNTSLADISSRLTAIEKD